MDFIKLFPYIYAILFNSVAVFIFHLVSLPLGIGIFHTAMRKRICCNFSKGYNVGFGMRPISSGLHKSGLDHPWQPLLWLLLVWLFALISVKGTYVDPTEEATGQ